MRREPTVRSGILAIVAVVEAGRSMKKHSRVERLLRVGVLLATLSAVEGCAAGPPGGDAQDRATTGRVQALLEQSTALQAPNQVSVQTVKHVVYLRGLVSTPYQKRLAQSLAAQADEGLQVVNLIAVENNH